MRTLTMRWCQVLVPLPYAREERLLVSLRRAVDIVSGRTAVLPTGVQVYDLNGDEISISDLVTRAAEDELAKIRRLH